MIETFAHLIQNLPYFLSSYFEYLHIIYSIDGNNWFLRKALFYDWIVFIRKYFNVYLNENEKKTDEMRQALTGGLAP